MPDAPETVVTQDHVPAELPDVVARRGPTRPRPGRAARGVRWCGAAALLLGAMFVNPTPAAADDAPRFHNDACHDLLAFVPVAAERARPYLPSHFELLEPAPGTALAIVRSARCERKGPDGQTAPTVEGNMALAIEDPDGGPADLPGLGLGDPQSIDQYMLFWAQDNEAAVNWLGMTPGDEAGPLTDVLYTRNMTWSFNPLLGLLDPSFRFEARSPVLSPFRMRAVAQNIQPAGTNLIGTDIWLEDKHGTVKVEATFEGLRPGAAVGRIDAAPGSQMASILGSTSVAAAMGEFHWTDSTYTRHSCGWRKTDDPVREWTADCVAQ
ncbi:hypothetical protein [Streptomyces cylindrosporus]|uniref:Secreted protein n=1 Tax=Streptomyces cylindrosporus TaxID=2927583 RepID=A0ABS9Y2B5_9ACTN|nr:hypothetical protein [Streptomyces cylindrosporus]MCI3270670.1 hypothetical protein [Streptomyces cylindrosporus]